MKAVKISRVELTFDEGDPAGSWQYAAAPRYACVPYSH
jgi:hypothetical protein